MAEPEWGQKRNCPTCQTRFYDLTNNPTTCPGCGAEFPLEALSERKSTASRARPKPAAKPAPAAAAKVAKAADGDDDLIDSSDEEDDEIEADDDVLLDDEEEEDDDDLGEIGDVAPTKSKSEGDEET